MAKKHKKKSPKLTTVMCNEHGESLPESLRECDRLSDISLQIDQANNIIEGILPAITAGKTLSDEAIELLRAKLMKNLLPKLDWVAYTNMLRLAVEETSKKEEK